MDDRRAALLLALLALAGAGVRFALVPRGAPPGDVSLRAAPGPARGTLHETAQRAARLAQPLRPSASLGASLALFAIVATGACLLVSRLVFVLALKSYRSASS